MRELQLEYDVVVVGGGPAGLTAAGWLGRYRRRTLVVDSGENRNRWTEQVHGFYANDPATPEALASRAHEDLSQYPDVETVAGEVSEACRSGDGFELVVEGRPVGSRRVVIATGVRDVFPEVERFFDFYGSDIFHCSTCDGFAARGRSVAVFGQEAHVAGFAGELLDWADRVSIVTNGRPLEVSDTDLGALADHGIEVIEDVAAALLGERGNLHGVRLASGATVDCAMAFFSIEHRPVIGLAEQLGCELDDDGYIAVDAMALTSVDGVYAAGDVTGGLQLVGTAVGEGTLAGVTCATSLRGESHLGDAPPPAPRPGDVAPETLGDG